MKYNILYLVVIMFLCYQTVNAQSNKSQKKAVKTIMFYDKNGKASLDTAKTIQSYQQLASIIIGIGLLIGGTYVGIKCAEDFSKGYKGIINWLIAAGLSGLLIYSIPKIIKL